jgi:hypothetical protein
LYIVPSKSIKYPLYSFMLCDLLSSLILEIIAYFLYNYNLLAFSYEKQTQALTLSLDMSLRALKMLPVRLYAASLFDKYPDD